MFLCPLITALLKHVKVPSCFWSFKFMARIFQTSKCVLVKKSNLYSLELNKEFAYIFHMYVLYT